MEKERNRNYVRMFCSAVLAGIMIGVGGTVNLSIGGVAGSFLFAVGLFSIVVFGLNLFTGKVGYLLEQPVTYLMDLVVIWCGNLIGTYLTGLAVRHTRIYEKIGQQEKVGAIVDAKLSDGMLSIFILSIFCGLLMYIAVDTYKKNSNPISQVITIFVPVSVFILSGFEHVVANMFYFSLANIWNVQALLLILVMTIGNSLGALLIPLYKKI